VKSNREYGLSKKQEKVEKGFDSKTQVGEYKRRCNQCGKIWHSLVSREKELEGNVKFNAFIQFGTAIGGNLSAATQSKRNVESNQDILDKMRQCPNCGSRNYSEDILTYEKR
jgi:ribosomal protein S27AE